MSNKADRSLLDAIHEAIATDLLRRIKSGEATAADLSVARQFLKDNGIDNIPRQGDPLRNLIDELPNIPDERLFSA